MMNIYHTNIDRILVLLVVLLLLQICKYFCCTLFQSNVAASNAKLSLFYDWISFDPEKDSIMNIGKIFLAFCFVGTPFIL